MSLWVDDEHNKINPLVKKPFPTNYNFMFLRNTDYLQDGEIISFTINKLNMNVKDLSVGLIIDEGIDSDISVCRFYCLNFILWNRRTNLGGTQGSCYVGKNIKIPSNYDGNVQQFICDEYSKIMNKINLDEKILFEFRILNNSFDIRVNKLNWIQVTNKFANNYYYPQIGFEWENDNIELELLSKLRKKHIKSANNLRHLI